MGAIESTSLISRLWLRVARRTCLGASEAPLPLFVTFGGDCGVLRLLDARVELRSAIMWVGSRGVERVVKLSFGEAGQFRT